MSLKQLHVITVIESHFVYLNASAYPFQRKKLFFVKLSYARYLTFPIIVVPTLWVCREEAIAVR